MTNSTLESLLLLNEQIALLTEAGVDFDLGLDANSAGHELERLSAEISKSHGTGNSLEEAIQSKTVAAPEAYQRLVREWLEGADLSSLMESYSRPQQTTKTSRDSLQGRLVYPFVVALLGCLVLAGYCLYLLPPIEAAYADLELVPSGHGIGWLQLARATLPYWIVILPVLLAMTFVWTSGKPASRGRPTRRRWAQASETLAIMLDADIEPAEAIEVASPPSGMRRQPWELPPLLKWAIEKPPRSEELRSIARLYEKMADDRSYRFRTLTPVIACVVIAGGATLLCSLALFLPFTELLYTLSQ